MNNLFGVFFFLSPIVLVAFELMLNTEQKRCVYAIACRTTQSTSDNDDERQRRRQRTFRARIKRRAKFLALERARIVSLLLFAFHSGGRIEDILPRMPGCQAKVPGYFWPECACVHVPESEHRALDGCNDEHRVPLPPVSSHLVVSRLRRR